MTSSLSGYSGPRGGGQGDVIPSGYRKGRIQQFTPQQMQAHEDSYSQISPNSYLSRLAGGDQETFNQMEAPALQQFSELQGNIASRFSGMGSLGGRKSSGFQNTSNAAASNFAQQLQANRQNLTRQAMQDLSGMTQQFLGQRPYEDFLYQKRQKKQNGWGGLAGAAVGGLGGLALGGPAGGMMGAQAGYGIGNALGGGGGGGNGGNMSSSGWDSNWLNDRLSGYALQGGM